MADLPERQHLSRTTSPLRSVSRWVWVLLLLAAAVVVVNESQVLGTDASSPLFAALPAAHLLVAAALMGVAGGARLIRLAAFSISVGPVMGLVQAYFSGPGYLLPAWVTESDYAHLAERMLNVTQLIQSFGWLFSLAAVLALAFYIGALHQPSGLRIVLVGVLLGLAQVTVFVASMLDFGPPDWILGGFFDQLAVQILGQLSVVAWAYFLAVVYERRMTFMSLAAGATLTGTVISIFASLFFGLGPQVDLFATISWIESLVALLSLAALVAGILLELPRSTVAERMTTGEPLAQELHSAAG